MSWGDVLKRAAIDAGADGGIHPPEAVAGATVGADAGSDVKKAMAAANCASDAGANTTVTTCQPPGPTAECASESPPPLQQFDQRKDPPSAEDLNNATLTVFGEMTATECKRWEDEAHAIASTIFNRRDLILKARADCVEARAAVSLLQAAYDKRKETSTRVSKADWADFKKGITEVQDQLGRAQRAANAACGDRLVAAESYLAPAERDKAPLLSRIVSAKAPDGNNQYEGYAKGIRDFNNYPSLPLPDKRRNCKRWAIARKAVEDLANGQPPDPYIEFRSNRNGARRKKAGETRICGNDFSLVNM